MNLHSRNLNKDIKKYIGEQTNRIYLCRYLCLIILIILTVIIGGCITRQDPEISSYTYKQSLEEGLENENFGLILNGTDNYTKNEIYIALNHTDKYVVSYISSINVVTEIKSSKCNDNNSTGCVVGNFTIDGKLKDANIYLLDRNLYKGLCNTFEHTLYHEIGHVTYFYKFGDRDPEREDKIYKESLELYADKYADQYSKIQGCDNDVIRQLENNLIEKEHIYQYALKILSKWDVYKNNGIPENMYSEYNYDYDLYLDAKKQYNDALETLKDYVKRTQD